MPSENLQTKEAVEQLERASNLLHPYSWQNKCDICGQQIPMGVLYETQPNGKLEVLYCQRLRDYPSSMPEWAKDPNYIRHGGPWGWGYRVGDKPINEIHWP